MRFPVIFLVATLTAVAGAQATAPTDPIGTARPSFSDTPQIVPVDHLQLEAGISYFSRGPGSDALWNFGEALLRYGVQKNVELRVGLPNYVDVPNGGPEGFDDTSVAASIYLGKFLGCDTGIIPAVSFPTGARGIRSDVVSPSILLNVQHPFGAGSLGTTLGAEFSQDDHRDVTNATATFVYAQNFSKQLIGFAEYAGFFDKFDEGQHYAHVGVQYLTSKTTQVDVHAGLGAGGAAHSFVGAGYSIRF